MGTLLYGPAETAISFDDTILSHLQLVIVAKLRRGESFILSWDVAPEFGGGRNTIWLNSMLPLMFKYDSNQVPVIDRELLERMSVSANNNRGLVMEYEPAPTMSLLRA